MIERNKTREKYKFKRKKPDEGHVTVKRSYYSFSEFYPGGGSQQKYRKVMHETGSGQKRKISLILTAFLLVIVAFVGYFTTNVALDIANETTTEVTTQQVTTAVATTEATTEAPTETTWAVTIEEPEREVNVTTTEQITTEPVTVVTTGEITEPVTEDGFFRE